MGEYSTLSIVKSEDWNIRMRWNSGVFTFLCSPSPSLRCLWRQTRRRRTRPRRTMESAPRPRTRGSMSSFVACYEICFKKHSLVQILLDCICPDPDGNCRLLKKWKSTSSFPATVTSTLGTRSTLREKAERGWEGSRSCTWWVSQVPI